MQALAEAASWSAADIGVRVPGGCPVTPEEVRRHCAGRATLAVLTSDSPWDVAETASWARVLVEVTSAAEARTVVGLGAAGVIARGAESGGRVSEFSTLVLLRQLLSDDTLSLPVWAAGGIGPHIAADCVLGGAAGVVLDTQLGLMPESDLPEDALRILRHTDSVPHGLLPVGQDTCLAEPFAATWRDTAAAVRGIRSSIEAGIRSALDAGQPIQDRASEFAGLLEPSPDHDRLGPCPLDIAVVGMSALFAGSPGTDAFWRTILSGEDMLTEVSADRWDPAIYYTPSPAEATPGRHTVSKWGGFLDPVLIDPLRYGIPPSALGSIDPSQLLALEVADQAMRDAGYPYDAAGTDHSRTGVIFAAEPGSDDAAGLTLRSLLPAYFGDVPAELDAQLPRYTQDTFPGHLANVIAGRIGNRFDLCGPNFTVDAACAASLAALDAACMHLTDRTADLMLCGAVDLHNSIGDFLMFGSVHALSPSGRIATFDRSADGTALGEGVACVVLKRLADARRDGDRVYAVIKGVGAASATDAGTA